MITCLALLSHITDEGINARATMPKVYNTVSIIFCYYKPFPCKTDEMFANFILSTRGAIRKPPSHFPVG